MMSGVNAVNVAPQAQAVLLLAPQVVMHGRCVVKEKA